MSVSTVSRVINNKPHVTEEKRRKVQEAMKALGYSPLQAARQMRGSGSNDIAVVVVPTITNNFSGWFAGNSVRSDMQDLRCSGVRKKMPDSLKQSRGLR